MAPVTKGGGKSWHRRLATSDQRLCGDHLNTPIPMAQGVDQRRYHSGISHAAQGLDGRDSDVRFLITKDSDQLRYRGLASSDQRGPHLLGNVVPDLVTPAGRPPIHAVQGLRGILSNAMVFVTQGGGKSWHCCCVTDTTQGLGGILPNRRIPITKGADQRRRCWFTDPDQRLGGRPSSTRAETADQMRYCWLTDPDKGLASDR